MPKDYVLAEDAVRDLEDIEDYVLGYADEAFVEALEDEFFDAFDKLEGSALSHPIYRFGGQDAPVLHEYRSMNVYHYKVFYYIRDDGSVVIYRIRHLASDFTRIRW